MIGYNYGINIGRRAHPHASFDTLRDMDQLVDWYEISYEPKIQFASVLLLIICYC